MRIILSLFVLLAMAVLPISNVSAENWIRSGNITEKEIEKKLTKKVSLIL
jgi:hypothetical protein